MTHDVIIVGAGVAGLQAALTLSSLGIRPLVLERESAAGGKVRDWHNLFPSFTPTDEVLGPMLKAVTGSDVEIRYGAAVSKVTDKGVELGSGENIAAKAVILATGYDIFDATIKEEYGYGLYDNVITSVDLERMITGGGVTTTTGRAPQNIALLHCVGSRDEKVCQRHCSRVCCIVGVKQAIELKKLFPAANIHNFYMDIRMFGPGYEELYRQAQIEYNIDFVRGRISEASQTIDGRVQIKAEDTLVGRPLKMTVDMLVLLVGMKAPAQNQAFAATKGIELLPSGFLAPRDPFAGNVSSNLPNVFYAGAVTAPKNIGESMSEGAAAATKAYQYLRA